MSRRCHHGSPRHARPPGRERRRAPASGERPSVAPPALDTLGVPEPGPFPEVEPSTESFPVPGVQPILDALPPDLDDAAILEATSALDVDDVDQMEPEAISEEPSGVDASVEIDTAAADEVVAPDAAAARIAEPIPALDAAAPQRAGVPSARPLHADEEAVRPEPPRVAQAWAPPPVRSMPPSARPAPPPAGPGDEPLERGATAPQLRRFIKSRAYVPMHELRRRFAINGGEDDVTPVDLPAERVYVGLPPREGSLLGELLRAGDIGYELSLDPIAPIVVGVYPMRPVPRS